MPSSAAAPATSRAAPQAADGAERDRAALVEERVVGTGERRPQVDAAGGEAIAGVRPHADDRRARRPEPDAPADDTGIGAERLAPEPLAEDDDGDGAAVEVGRDEAAADGRPDAEDVHQPGAGEERGGRDRRVGAVERAA